MKLKAIIPFVVALVLAGVAVHLGKGLLKGGSGAGKSIKVVVAAKDLEAGYQIKTSDVTLADMPVASIPAGALTKTSDAIGQVAAVPVFKGQSVVKLAIAPEGPGMRLQAQVPPGMRAVTMEVNEFSGIAGMLFPGCHVDIFSTLIDETTHRPVAKPIVQNAKVTAVGQKMATKSSTGKELTPSVMKSVTMVMGAKDAAALDLASSKGRPRLVLRGAEDESPVDFGKLTLEELIGQNGEFAGATTQPAEEPVNQAAASATPHAAKEKGFAVQVIQGGAVSEVTFDASGGEKVSQISAAPKPATPRQATN